MKDWSTLPAEILENIFTEVGAKYVFQCFMTCRAWNQAAERVLYSEVHLNSEEHAINPIETLENSNKPLGKWTRSPHYRFNDPSRPKYENHQHDSFLYHFAKLLPNVENLCPGLPNYAFYITPSCLPDNVKWRRLKTIERPKKIEDYRVYVDCLLAYSNYLSDLSPGQREKETEITPQCNRVMERLHVFSQLTNFQHIGYPGGLSGEEYVDYIVNSCSTLTSLNLDISGTPNSQANIILPTVTTINTSSVSAAHGIRHLKIDASNHKFTNSLIQYIMKNFTGLQSLQLHFG